MRVSLVNLLTAVAAAGIVASGLWAADNLTIKEPTTPTATVKSDDVAGVHYQGFKIYDGTADGTTGLVVTGAGAAKVDGSAVTQPVSDAGGSLTVDGTVTANQGGAPWSENVSQFGGAAVATGVGGSGAGIPRVTIAADAHDAAVTERGVRISGYASAAAPGNVSADGDNVSLWSLRNGQLVQQPAFSGTLASTGSGASGGGTQRVILATDQPVVPVSDNAGSLTVDGTVGVSGTVTVDSEFANVTDGAAAGTTGIHVLGTDGTNAQIIKTDTGGAVQIDCESGCGGGTQFAEDAAHTTGDLGTMALAVRNDSGGALAGATGDYIPLTTDASGALRVTGGGGGTEVTEDAASAADPTGGQLMVRRRDTPAAETSTDGDVIAANATNKGEIYVKHIDAIPVTDNAGSLTVDGSVSLAAALPAGTNNIGDVDVLTVPAPLSTTGGGTEATALRVTVANDSTGVLSVDDNGASLTIDAASLPLPTGAATSANQTTEITALQLIDNLPLADDAAFTVATTNVAAMGCIEATDTMDAGDVGAVKCGSDRELDVDLVSAIPAGTNNIGDVDVLTVPAPLSTTGGGTEATALRVTVANDSTGVLSVDDNGGALTVDNAGTFAVQPSQATAANLNAEVQGDAAHDAAVSGNPVLTGAYAETPDDSAPGNQVSAEADATRLAATRDGALYVAPYGSPRIWEVSDEVTTQQTDTSLKAAPGAGLSFYVTDIKIACNGAVTVSFEEDDTTDDLIDRLYCAGAGDGQALNFSVPHKMTANQALLLTTSAAVTVFYSVHGFTGP